jgi:Co/Zn/Cd efflux system component
VSLSLILIFLPVLSSHATLQLDVAIGFLYALAMVVLGGRLCYAVGRMLLMSFSGEGLDDVLLELNGDSSVQAVDEAKVWQVHYGLCMANFKIRVKTVDHVERLRERVASLVKSRLDRDGGKSGVRWEVSTEVIVEK